MQLLTPQLLQAEAAQAGAAREVRWVASMGHTPALIGNVDVEVQLLRHHGLQLPLTRCDGWRPGQSYVASPQNTYVAYAAAEIPPLPLGLGSVLRRLVQLADGPLAARQLDRHVAINNWLLSTNLYPPDWQGEGLPTLTRALTDAFPDHALLWRSLNPLTDPQLSAAFRAAGYVLLPSRRVFVIDMRTQDERLWRCRSLQRDRALRARGEWETVPASAMQEADFERMAALYRLLYRDKYSHLNPDYSADWLRLGHTQGWLELVGVRRASAPAEGLQGMVGWFRTSAVQSSPLLGYNTALPVEKGLYRLLGLLSMEQAWQRACLLNFSAGAPQWKQARGAVPVVEYSAVHIAHLAPARQRPWRVLQQLATRLALPLIERYNL